MPENPLRRYLRVQREIDTDVRRILIRAAEDITRRVRLLDITPGVGAKVRAAQLRLTLDGIRRELSSAFVGQLEPAVVRGMGMAAQAAIDASQVLDDVLWRATGNDRRVQVMMNSIRDQAINGLRVDAARQRRQLAPRVYRDYIRSAQAIEDIIRSSIIQGDSARELARLVFRFVSPSTPGGASYAAMRLARTEINNAFHQQQIRSADKWWVDSVRWNLSGSHPRSDACNVYADRGTFPPKEVPAKPHPQCLCFLTYDTMSPDQFVDELISREFAIAG